MDRSDFGAGPFRNRSYLRRRELVWLYDPISEEFHHAAQLPEVQRFDIMIRPPRRYLIEPPRSLLGRLAFGLFITGWMCPVVILGPMVFAIIAWLAGVR